MSTTTQNLCYNCFQHIEDPAAPCPYCGFDLAENAGKFPVALQAGTVLNNRYIVGRVLGQGGFGITYLAFDTQLQAKVAVKEYMPGELAARVDGTTVSAFAGTKTDDFTYGAERFQEEARTLAKFIGHPNIAGVSSYFDENNTSYFVMDYIEGVSFKNYIANNGGKVSVDEALNVMIPVLRALTAVHAEGFIHRDVTPDNIYISKDGNVKLLDFGSARYSIGDKSKSLDVILKVGYAPKEQYIRRGRQGPYTDVYSCAACFYAALTGVLPPESLERLDHDELVPVSQAGIDIPDWLDRAILKGLAVQPEDRFQSAAEFLDAIENQIAVEVPIASAPVQPEKKKPKTALIAGIAAALAVVLGVGIFVGSRGGGEVPSPVPNEQSPAADNTPEGPADDGLPPLKEAEVPSITIQGVEYSTDLRELDLSDCTDLTNDDIKPLAEMKNLETLSLGNYAEITDLTPLSGLTQLRSLSLGSRNRNLTDLSPLVGLVNLEELYLPAEPNYQNFDALANMTKLKDLSMLGTKSTRQNSVGSLEFLTNLTDLETLSICVGSVDLNPVTGLTRLRTLEIFGELYAEDLSVFRNLINLEILQLHISNSTMCAGAQPRDFSELSGLTKLRSLCIHGDEVNSLTGLEGMKDMEELTLVVTTQTASNTITTLEPLGGMTKLRDLTLFASTRENINAPPLDISALSKLENLDTVYLFPKIRILDPSPVDHVPNVVIDG